MVWLVNGNVTIDGVLSLNGQDAPSAPTLAEPGPGGFRGGTGYFASNVGASAGFGPGGGQWNIVGNGWGGGGSYGSAGAYGPPTYGNPSLIPLLGGSGGGGYGGDGRGGGAGAGAILIASPGTISLPGTIRANGGGTLTELAAAAVVASAW